MSSPTHAPMDHEGPFRPGLAEHAAQIKAATGTEPLFLERAGPPHDAERIAHCAPCSVLVVRS